MGVWQPLPIPEIVDRFATSGVDWWIAGGRAIDAFVGWETRHHDDVDVEMWREDRDILFDVFTGWEAHAVSEGQWIPYSLGDDLADEVFGIWLRSGPDAPWAVEVILASRFADRWAFRRNPSITLPVDRLVLTNLDGVPFCTPEVQLLYKAKRHRPKDDADLTRCLHRMSGDQARWLIDALEEMHRGHPWIRVLEVAIAGRQASSIPDPGRVVVADGTRSAHD